MKKIGIIVAMQKELELYTEKFGTLTEQTVGNINFYRGTYKNSELCIAVSGMGKVCASMTISAMIDHFRPDLVVNIGISGGVDKSIKIGDVIIGENLVYHDVWCGIPNKIGQVQDYPENYQSACDLVTKLPEYKKGLFCTGDLFVSKIEEVEKIKSNFPEALAVDMESCAFAQICYVNRIPFISVRQISDVPGTENHQEQYETFWQHAPENSAHILFNILEKL